MGKIIQILFHGMIQKREVGYDIFKSCHCYHLKRNCKLYDKIGMLKIGDLDGLRFSEIRNKIATNYILWLGCFCFVIAFVAYSYALSKVNLSIAYPIMTSLGYAILILSSVFFLKETLNSIQVIGILFIIFGVWMVTQ